ncbi:hypothetical protein [Chengkuizengella sediminis]|uniref:hypothetical protein n=1 Tax=Chengkuizengella sediminis TaxID=1885917 RepID=UPI001389CA9E|nr:hypothetical protein [Chengkuizengella sediminis]NDI35675.1 hypothetical protein [Chengkuizengella sediminis]
MNNINPYAPASVMPASNVMPAYDMNQPAYESPAEYENLAPATYAANENLAPAKCHPRRGGWHGAVIVLVLFILLVIILSRGLLF